MYVCECDDIRFDFIELLRIKQARLLFYLTSYVYFLQPIAAFVSSISTEESNLSKEKVEEAKNLPAIPATAAIHVNPNVSTSAASALAFSEAVDQPAACTDTVPAKSEGASFATAAFATAAPPSSTLPSSTQLSGAATTSKTSLPQSPTPASSSAPKVPAVSTTTIAAPVSSRFRFADAVPLNGLSPTPSATVVACACGDIRFLLQLSLSLSLFLSLHMHTHFLLALLLLCFFMC